MRAPNEEDKVRIAALCPLVTVFVSNTSPRPENDKMGSVGGVASIPEQQHRLPIRAIMVRKVSSYRV